MTQVLDELGLQLTDQLSGLPTASGSISVATTGKVPVVAQDGGAAPSQPNDADANLQARLDNLRRKWTMFFTTFNSYIYNIYHTPI